MSKQLNFFLSRSDEAVLAEFLTKSGAIAVEEQSSSPELEFRRSIQREKSVFEKLCLLHEKFSEHIVFKEIKNKFYINEQKSDIIEYSPSYIITENQTIKRGRLYVVTDYFDTEDRLIRKNDPFLKWADSILRGARKMMSKGGKWDFWYGPEALELEMQGWTTSPL